MGLGGGEVVLKKKREKQFKFLLENFTKPVLESDGFGEIKYEENGYSPTGISLAILNCNMENSFQKEQISPNQIATFMSRIQGYLPKELRPSDYRCKPLFTSNSYSGTCQFAPETLELLDAIREWYLEMKYRIMNDITFKYFIEGKVQYNEILKRRFKNEYSEKVEQTVQAAVKADNSINIVIDEA
jgi:hypothetical protein